MENWDLIAKYLAGECTDTEKQELESWLEENAQNKALFNKMSKVWQKSEELIPDFQPDVNVAFSKVSQKLSFKVQETKIRKLNLTTQSGRIAAVFVLFVSLFSLIFIWQNAFQSSPTAWVDFNTSDQDTTMLSLSDGTKIWLKKNTTFRYPKKFGSKNREVFLEGEAFFEVARDERRPFLIRSGEASTEVLGTSFQVKARKEEKDVQVQVLSGKVALYDTQHQENKVILHPGNLGKFNRESLEVEKIERSNPNDLAWKTGIIRFKNTPLSEVVQILSEYYHVKVSLVNESQNDCKINVSFEKMALEDVFKIITRTFKNFKLEKTKEGYIIYVKECR